MNETITPETWRIIISLGTAIAALATYVVHLNRIDRKDRKETQEQMVNLVKQSTEVNTALKASVEANTKTTDALHRAVSDYMRAER